MAAEAWRITATAGFRLAASRTTVPVHRLASIPINGRCKLLTRAARPWHRLPLHDRSRHADFLCSKLSESADGPQQLGGEQAALPLDAFRCGVPDWGALSNLSFGSGHEIEADLPSNLQNQS